MSSTIFLNNTNSYTTRTVTFSLNGTPADPSGAITCVVTDPSGNQTTYTYNPGAITKVATGEYALKIQCSPSVSGSYGLWSLTWIGAGTLDQNVLPDTFRTLPAADATTGLQSWYCGKEELKARLNGTGITDNLNDYELEIAIQTVTDWITQYVGQHFYQLTETRSFVPATGGAPNIYAMDIDPCVSVSQINLSYNGATDNSGNVIYDQMNWSPTNYQLIRAPGSYNINQRGIPRPYTSLKVIGSGNAGPIQFLPFVWPFTPNNRVQIVGTWGWPVVPPNVVQAALILATDLFLSKDAPFGVVGTGQFAGINVKANPWVVELLRPYINVETKVGV